MFDFNQAQNKAFLVGLLVVAISLVDLWRFHALGQTGDVALLSAALSGLGVHTALTVPVKE